MKRLYWIIVTILFLIPTILHGQEFKVKSFYLAETDLTAITPGTMKDDQNGDLCALIKVESVIDLLYDFGMKGHTSIERVGSEQWVYISYGTKKISVNHPKLGVIREYSFPCEIEKGRTYIMTFETPKNVGTDISVDLSKRRNIVIHLYPDNAEIVVSGTLWKTENGICSQNCAVGTHSAIVTAENYHTAMVPIRVTEEEDTQHFSISLKPAYGWLNIKAEGDETLTLDDKPYEFAPNQNLMLASRHYQLHMTKPLHKPYVTDIEIKDSTVCEITPHFEVNYKEVDLRVGNNADIYVDNVKVGNGSWKGRLEYGEHLITCKKESHKDAEMTIDVHSGTLGPVMLNAPEPIYGILDVSSTPAGSEVYVDNRLVGHTPCSVDALIGLRNVEVKKSGFVPQTKTVLIVEAKRTPMEVTLTNIMPVTFKSTPKGTISIDGKTRGKTPYSTALSSGVHNISITAPGYYEMKKTINLSEASKTYTYNLKKRYYYPSSFYFSGEYQALTYSGFKGSIGFCIRNINVEANYVYGFKESETIYWNVPGQMVVPYGYKYRPHYAGAKIGYSITPFPRLRMTPQVGIGMTILEGRIHKTGDIDPNAYRAYCIPFNAGMRLDFAIAPMMAITVRPEYSMPLYECDLYKVLTQASDAIASYSSGISASVGLCFFF